jgi:hypothetical protein
MVYTVRMNSVCTICMYEYMNGVYECVNGVYEYMNSGYKCVNGVYNMCICMIQYV